MLFIYGLEEQMQMQRAGVGVCVSVAYSCVHDAFGFLLVVLLDGGVGEVWGITIMHFPSLLCSIK